ncbi:hypothetical protein [Pedobacter frigoris]|uniref:Uncharacterized protein n=1 Tax=Pedobacter frigoris TaxID=2571272 RepID=A0A4U1CPX7_9SPHI|nr:hypothetical protein [Pedobacter frigoris]TKC09584.1 hypothetical protein FA047_05720 [Pedobacter frigoris]
MRIIFCLILCLISGYSGLSEPKVTELRNLFYESESDKSAWAKFVKLVESVNTKSSPLLVCYKGVSEMMGAKYTVNPVSKLRKFKKGKFFIEEAVKREPANIEIRFLRFSIQTNLPTFLGYNDQIKEDKLMLLNNLSKIRDKNLKTNIATYLSSSKYCTEEEKKKL